MHERDKYSDFLVAMISVGLAQARPNNIVIITEILPIVIFADRSLRHYSIYIHIYIYMPRPVSLRKCSCAQNVRRTDYAGVHGPSEIFSFLVIVSNLRRCFETKYKISHINSHFLLHISP